MKRVKKFRKAKSKNLILLYFVLVCLVFLSIGYAAITAITGNIEGTIYADAQDSVFIADVMYDSDIDANLEESKVLYYYGTMLNTKVQLGENSNSSITYKVTLYNNSLSTYQLYDVSYLEEESSTYSNQNITYEISGFSLGDKINAGETKYLYITFKYKAEASSDSTLTSFLNFNFALNAKQYTINFDANEGTVSTSSKLVDFFGTYGELPMPTREGYTFEGWYTEKDEGIEITEESILEKNEDQTLYAYWTINQYTITFDADGGNVSTSSKKVTYNSSYGILPIPTRTGYTFDGWHTSKRDGLQVTEESIVEITEDQTLYAYWKYTVTLDENGGSEVNDIEVICNHPYSNLPITTRQGYTFIGWYTELSEGILISDTVIVEEPYYTILYARWEKQNIKDDFSSNVEEVAFYQSADINNDGVSDYIDLKLKCGASHEKMNIPLTNLITGKTYTLKFKTFTDAIFDTENERRADWRYGCYVSATKNTSIENNTKDLITSVATTGSNNWRCTEDQVGNTHTITLTFEASANTMYWIWEFGAIKDDILNEYHFHDIELNRVDNENIKFSSPIRLPSSSTYTYQVNEANLWNTNYTLTGASGCERAVYEISGLISGKTYTITFSENYMGDWVETGSVSYEYGCVVLTQSQYTTFSGSPGSADFLENYNNSCIIMRSAVGRFEQKLSSPLTISFVASGDKAYWVWDYGAVLDGVPSDISLEVTNMTISEGNITETIYTSE